MDDKSDLREQYQRERNRYREKRAIA